MADFKNIAEAIIEAECKAAPIKGPSTVAVDGYTLLRSIYEPYGCECCGDYFAAYVLISPEGDYVLISPEGEEIRVTFDVSPKGEEIRVTFDVSHKGEEIRVTFDV